MIDHDLQSAGRESSDTVELALSIASSLPFDTIAIVVDLVGNFVCTAKMECIIHSKRLLLSSVL